MKTYDALIIGTGQAGPSLAAALANTGKKVAIVERKRFGGTCVNTGCTPTKTLIASAKVAHMAKNAQAYGILIDEGRITVDMKKVKERKDKIVKQSNTGVEHWMKHTKNLEVYEGHARFTSNKVVEIDGAEQIGADHIFINVGGRALVLDDVKDAQYFTNSSIMDVDFVPDHLVIVGGSYIGLEFAQMYRRFGSKVTVIEMKNRVVSQEDPDVSLEVQHILEREGVQFRLEAECIKATQDGDTVVVDVICKEGDPQVRGSHLLVAVGRVPNTHDLGLENTTIKVDGRGYIPVNDTLETNVEGIWALGDVNGIGGFTHTAYNDYEIVANRLFGDATRTVKDRLLCYALYVDPPLARVGISEVEALKEVEKGRNILVGRRPMSKVSRAREKGEDLGFMKIFVDADTREILGFTILGVNGDEIIHSILDSMYAKTPYTVLQRAVHIHPTVSELIPTLLGELELLKRPEWG